MGGNAAQWERPMAPEEVEASASAKTPAGKPDRPRLRRVCSAELFQGRQDVIIIHNEEEYHLRITRLGKLILTK